MTSEEKWSNKKLTRREFLKKAGIGSVGAVMGASTVGAILSRTTHDDDNNTIGKEQYTFYGDYQSGIQTPSQSNVYFVVLDLTTTNKNEIIQMFKDWTVYSQRLMNGKEVDKESSNHYLPPKDTGEVIGLNPYRLTLTYGIGPSFLDKLNLKDKKISAFKDLPLFPRDQLQPQYTGGDICIQACADDAQVAFHAIRNLIRKARACVSMKWSQTGFTAIGNGKETPRNLFGFKDGTANARDNKKFNDIVWCKDNNWLYNGTYMAVRRIQMHLETWDRTNLNEQENTFGRHKHSGAPFGEKDEFAEIDLNKKDSDGKPLIPTDSHVHLAHKVGKEIYRRSFSYASGISDTTGQFDSGLLFISFQKDPSQFIDIQNSLGNEDKMNEYITHVGSGLFACFGGIKEGEYIGQKLFE